MKYKHKKTDEIACLAEGNTFYSTITFGVVHRKLVEDSSDWEKIEERDYIVTEYYAGKGGDNSKAKLVGGGKYQMYWANGEGAFKPVDESSLTVGSWQIYSVKCLSDGQEFKIGDIVEYGLATYVIDSFSNRVAGSDELFVTGKDNRDMGNAIPITNLRLQLEKKPVLYTTEDGVKRYEWSNEEHWIIFNTRDNKWRYTYELKVNEGNVEYTNQKDTYRIFSTKEAADKWIEQNNPKPIFTTEDGKDIYYGDEYFYVTEVNPEEVKSRTANSGSGGYSTTKYFSSKEAAEAYVEKNKPKKLFTTSDGKDIYEGDVYYGVFRLGGQVVVPFNGNCMDNTYYIYFSTEKLAQKYIDDNSKFLLTEDGGKVRLGDMMYWVTDDFYIGSTTVMEVHFPKPAYPPYASKQKAEEYVRMNQKKYSFADIEKGIMKIQPILGDVILRELKKSL